MEAPYTIASLVKPLDAENGRTQASAVYGLRGSKKRKRHEVAVGVDGEGVNIYNIQSQNLITTYALPPQARLCCPPCSVYSKLAASGGAQRRTYLALRDGPTDAKRRLVCFADDSPSTDAERATGTTRKEAKLQSSDICGLDAIGTPAGAAVVVSYSNGNVECRSENLSTIIWTHDASDNIKDPVMEYAAVVETEHASRGFLAGREDLLALLQPFDKSGNQFLLCRIERSGTSRWLHLLAIRHLGPRPTHGQSPALTPAGSIPLPGLESAPYSMTHEVHAASGRVYSLSRGKLTVHDLNGGRGRLRTIFEDASDPILSFVRLSTSTVLAIHQSHAVVCETKYGSTLASVPLSSASVATGDKRRRSGELPSTTQSAMVANFSEIGLATGLIGNELVAFQLSEDIRRQKRAKGDISLSDVYGKGAVSDWSKPLDDKAEAGQLIQWEAAVNAALESKKAHRIEGLARKTLGIRQAEDLVDGRGNNSGVIFDPRTGAAMGSDNLNRRRNLYLLSKLVRLTSEKEQHRDGVGRLALTVHSASVYKLFGLAGYLNHKTLKLAMMLYGASTAKLEALQPGDIMSAIRDFDSTFDFLRALLDSPIRWDLEDLLCALSLIVQSLEDDASAALTSTDQPSDEQAAVNLDNSEEAHLDSQLTLLERQLQITVSALEHGVSVRSTALRLVSDRLASFPASTVTKTMRKMMRQEDVLFLIKLLRIELLEGSWHQQYVPTETDPADFGDNALAIWRPADTDSDKVPSNRAVERVAFLLNACIDSLSLSGWLVGQSADASGTFNFIDELKTEISATAEALFQYEQVRVYLEEVQGYEVAAQRRAGGRGEELVQELPVGWRGDVQGGKRLGKGARFRAMERRSRVGVYGVERIRI